MINVVYFSGLSGGEGQNVSMGFCNDPDSHKALATPVQFFQFIINIISLSTTSDNVGYWQFASGKYS